MCGFVLHPLVGVFPLSIYVIVKYVASFFNFLVPIGTLLIVILDGAVLTFLILLIHCLLKLERLL